jgi:hypothetical protein
MIIGRAEAPGYERLRPFKSTSETANRDFPVYQDLAKYLASREKRDQPDDITRHVMAVCAGYSYARVEGDMQRGDQQTGASTAVATMMARMGLLNNRCRMIAEYVDAMLIFSTAFIVQSEERDVVILSYRGTEPGNLLNWLTTIQVHSGEPALIDLGQDSSYQVHAGFYRNVRMTRYEVLRALQWAMAGKSVLDARIEGTEKAPGPKEPLPALYVTGHSLGGAMAAIFGIMAMTDPEYRDVLGRALRAVYTFGQPMIGPPGLEEAYRQIPPEYRAPLVRYVYCRDPVPHLPPAETGRFGHFGEEWSWGGSEWDLTYDESGRRGRPVGQMKDILGLGEAFVSLAAEQSQLMARLNLLPSYSITDHLPQYYIDSLASSSRSEFGDDSLRPGPSCRPQNGQYPSFLDQAIRFGGDTLKETARGALDAVGQGRRAVETAGHTALVPARRIGDAARKALPLP